MACNTGRAAPDSEPGQALCFGIRHYLAVAAERAAKSGKKNKKGKKKPKKKGKKDKKDKKKKGKKDPTADRSLESLYAELVSNKIIQAIPARTIGDYVGDFNYLGATLEKAGIVPDASMAQVRQVLTEYGILPMGAGEQVHAHIPTHTKSILMYGSPRTGKTTLAHAVANAAGANFFNLSPRHTDGKYPGSQVKMLIHMVFKVARVMQPSVIYIDQVEKVGDPLGAPLSSKRGEGGRATSLNMQSRL